MTFINKLDRESRDPLELLDEIESILKITCTPITWPIGMGKAFKGIYHLYEDRVYLFKSGDNARRQEAETLDGLTNPEIDKRCGVLAEDLREQVELLKTLCPEFNRNSYLAGEQTPVFFGSAMNNFGIKQFLDSFSAYAPEPQPRPAKEREVKAEEPEFSGFVFKIQANMDPNHRDRIAFLRICSGQYKKGMKLAHLRLKKTLPLNNALTFMAGQREHAETATAGDIIGIHNHGTIQIGDSFTSGEELKFTGIPNFAPELFRTIRLNDPLKAKALLKGLLQLSEEGATQVFRPLQDNQLIVGAVGVLQFDVVADRLKHEYKVDPIYQPTNVATARWVRCSDAKMLADFKNKLAQHLALDSSDSLTYLAPSKVNLTLTMERWPDIEFLATREH